MKNFNKNSMSNLTSKQVINVCNGKILGYVTDFVVDPCNGCLNALILPGENGLFTLKKCNNIIVPWENICKIGEDVILVDLEINITQNCDCNKK